MAAKADPIPSPRTISFQCPDDFWEAVRLEAVRQRVSTRVLCIRALAAWLEIAVPDGVED